MNRWLFRLVLGALLLRIVGLGAYPLGFHVDEVRVGWNAYSILKTGFDDRGNRLALYYNTFGDYRPTGIFYLTIPSIALFGPTPFAVRLPGALIGALTLVPLFYLTQVFTKSRYIGYISATFLALTPWHWIVSRATSEGIMSLFFGLWGILFFLYGLKKPKRQYFIISGLSFLGSCLLYHAARPLTPLFLLLPFVYYWKTLLPLAKRRGLLLIMVIVVFVGILLGGKGSLSRYRQVTVNNPIVTQTDPQKISSAMKVRDQYLDYVSFDFLIGNLSRPYRYRVFGVSLMGSVLVLFFLIGITQIVKKKTSALPLYFLLLSPLPAAVTLEDSPNLHRAIFMLPFLLIIAASGAMRLIEGSLKAKISFLGLCVLFSLTTMSGIVHYFGDGAADAAPYRDIATRDLITEINNRAATYDHVVITNKPDSPYPWYAFYNRLDPAEFNAYAIQRTNKTWTYKNLMFTDNECPAADTFDKNTTTKGLVLVIDGMGCAKDSILKDIPGTKIVTELKDTTGAVRYRFWEKRN